MFGDMFGNMEEMQAKMRAELAEISVDAEAGDGAIKVTANGNREITNISIAPEALEDPEMIEDLLMVAVNRALEAAAAREAEEMQRNISSMLPPGMGNLGGLFG